MERVMIFIDGSNLYHGLKAAVGHARIDFGRFCTELCGSSRRLVHAHYYNVPLPADELHLGEGQEHRLVSLDEASGLSPRIHLLRPVLRAFARTDAYRACLRDARQA